MKKEDFNKLSKEQQQLEIEKCKSSEYFYNNYCKKEGMPEYSEDVWQNYVEQVSRQRVKPSRMGYKNNYPLTPDECFKI